MEFVDVIKKRRSVRRYKNTLIDDRVVDKALDCALLAPNSSNIQAWEFYWVKSPDKKNKLIEACFSQGAARTAAHLVVAVARLDTWKRNRDILMKEMIPTPEQKQAINTYYKKIIPFLYFQDPLGLIGFLKWPVLRLISLFRPMFTRPAFRSDVFEVVVKSTALACENFMLSIVDQGYGCCPMEGFDESRVKKILNLGWNSRIVMVISVGDIDPQGVFGPQYRISSDKFIFKI